MRFHDDHTSHHTTVTSSPTHNHQIAHLLFDLLEAVQDRHTRDTVYLAERHEAHLVQAMLTSHLSKVDDGAGKMVDYAHGLLVLYTIKTTKITNTAFL